MDSPALVPNLASATWRASATAPEGGGRVEIADLGHHVAMRDSSNPEGPILVFTPHEWDCFLDGAGKGEFVRGNRVQPTQGN